MFADDATFSMEGSFKYFQKLKSVLDDFNLMSGPNLNVNKTIVFRVGSLRCTNIQHLENMRFLWTSFTAKH